VCSRLGEATARAALIDTGLGVDSIRPVVPSGRWPSSSARAPGGDQHPLTGTSIVVDGGNIIHEPHGLDMYGAA
jgi:hypothetical protein